MNRVNQLRESGKLGASVGVEIARLLLLSGFPVLLVLSCLEWTRVIRWWWRHGQSNGTVPVENAVERVSGNPWSLRSMTAALERRAFPPPQIAGVTMAVAVFILLLIVSSVTSTATEHPRIDVRALFALLISQLMLVGVLAASQVMFAGGRENAFPHGRSDTDPAYSVAVTAGKVMLLMLGPTVAISMLQYALSGRSDADTNPVLTLGQSLNSPRELLILYLAVAVGAPLGEEYVFRVVLQSWLSQHIRVSLAVPLVALLFAMVHGTVDMIPLLPVALVLGYSFAVTGSYATVVLAHALFNTVMTTYALLISSMT